MPDNDEVGEQYKIKTLYINIQSLFNKLDELDVLINNENIDILCLSEHWVKDHSLKFCNINNFVLANAFCRVRSLRGGVIIYIKSNYEFKKVECLDKISQELHCEIASIEIVTLNSIIINIYRSPNGDINIFFEILTKLFNRVIKLKRNIYIYGDFNIDILGDSEAKKYFCNLVQSYNYNFLINGVTRPQAATCLDNCITNDKFGCEAKIIDPNISDHFGIINISKHRCRFSNVKKTSIIKFRPYSQQRAEYCINKLKQINWDILNIIEDLDNAFDYFLETILQIINESFPLKTKTVLNNNKNKKWFNHELKVLRDNLNFFAQLSRQNQHNDELRNYAKCLKKQYRSKIKQYKSQYVSDKILYSTNKTKSTWSIINESKNESHKQMNYSFSADDFNTFVTNIAENESKNLAVPTLNPMEITRQHIQCPEVFFLQPVVEAEVDTIIRNLSNSSAKDIYGISNKLLKLIREGITLPLTIIINKCFLKGKFPSNLKLSKITPIYKKKGSKTCMSNHRPLSIIPSLSKPIEVALNDRLTSYLEKYKLLNINQYGFRKKSSTIKPLIKMVTHIHTAFERGEIVSSLFCDLSKAFDCMSHHILTDKLSDYGIRGIGHNLITSYLTDRKQITDCNGILSTALTVKAGVPQGSILGPLLFILYVNDLPCYLHMTNTIQYADDTTLYNIDDNINNLNRTKEVAQYAAKEWFTCNKLSLNVDKTIHINFSLKDIYSEADTVKFLGIHIDKKLNWKSHINAVCNKLSGIIFLLRKLSQYATTSVCRVAYFGLFHSQLSYGVILWGNSTEWMRVFVLQKMALRVITNKSSRESCRCVFNDLQILTFPALYIYHCLIYVKENQEYFNKQIDLHSHFTRYRDNIILPQHRLHITHKSFIYIALKLYNCLPIEIRNLSTIQFKAKIKHILLKISPYNLDEFYNTSFLNL